MSYEEISLYFRERGEDISPDEVRQIIHNAAAKIKAIYKDIPEDNEKLLDLIAKAAQEKLETTLILKIFSRFVNTNPGKMAQKVYKIKHTDLNLFKRKAKGRTEWHKDGDTYATKGIARSALANTVRNDRSLKDKLEIATFIMFEIKPQEQYDR